MSNKPKSLEAAERLAAAQGVSVEAVVEKISSAQGRYPGPDCFEPDEVELFCADPTLFPLERVMHFTSCRDCVDAVLLVLEPGSNNP